MATRTAAAAPRGLSLLDIPDDVFLRCIAKHLGPRDTPTLKRVCKQWYRHFRRLERGALRVCRSGIAMQATLADDTMNLLFRGVTHIRAHDTLKPYVVMTGDTGNRLIIGRGEDNSERIDVCTKQMMPHGLLCTDDGTRAAAVEHGRANSITVYRESGADDQHSLVRDRSITLAEDAAVQGPRISPDGLRVAYIKNKDHVCVFDVLSGETMETAIAATPQPVGHRLSWAGGPRWLGPRRVGVFCRYANGMSAFACWDAGEHVVYPDPDVPPPVLVHLFTTKLPVDAMSLREMGYSAFHGANLCSTHMFYPSGDGDLPTTAIMCLDSRATRHIPRLLHPVINARRRLIASFLDDCIYNGRFFVYDYITGRLVCSIPIACAKSEHVAHTKISFSPDGRWACVVLQNDSTTSYRVLLVRINGRA